MFGRVSMVQGPIACGDARSSHSISVKDKSVAQNINAWASAPIPALQSYELAISRTKRGGVEFIMAGCILLASLV